MCEALEKTPATDACWNWYEGAGGRVSFGHVAWPTNVSFTDGTPKWAQRGLPTRSIRVLPRMG